MDFMRGTLVCLAGAMMVCASAADAAGTEGNGIAPIKIIVAQDTVEEVGLNVTATCQGKAVVFSFLNIGEPWPAMAAIKIFRVSDRSVLFQRSMRMAKMQKGSFKLQADKNPGGEIGFFVEPSWISRKFTVDAKATCN